MGILNRIWSRIGAPAGASVSVDVAAVKSDTAAIKVVTDAVQTLTESNGSLTATGGEDTIYTNNAPAGAYKPVCVKIDFTNHTVTESVTLRTYYRIKNAGNYIKQNEVSWTLSVPSPLLISIDLEANRYGVKVTLEKTAGTNRVYDWEVLYEE
jgi:hypothetical protein